MSSTNKLVIIIAVILIIICLIVGNRKAQETNIIMDTQNLEQIREITYDTVTNEITGEDEYVVYDKETGREITRVDEEYQLKIYELDPNYEEIPKDKIEEPFQEESIIE